MAETNEIPHKPYYKASEVCQLTDTQPYVLRFWESEFPQLAPKQRTGGQPVYRREDIDLVLRIKKLLYEDEQTIEGARRALESGGETAVVDEPHAAEPVEAAGASQARLPLAEREDDSVLRQRYDDAVEEITHLRLQVKEAEARLRRAEGRLQKACGRLQSVLDRLERGDA